MTRLIIQIKELWNNSDILRYVIVGSIMFVLGVLCYFLLEFLDKKFI